MKGSRSASRIHRLTLVFLALLAAAAFATITAGAASRSGTASKAFACHPTHSNSGAPPVDFLRGNYFVANRSRSIWVAIPEKSGKVSIWDGEATQSRNGSVSMLLPWWNTGPGALRLSGKRLDRRVGAHPRFVGQGATFPSIGCWQVVGSTGTSRLSITLEVMKRSG